MINSIIIPVLVIFITFYGFYKKIYVYDEFINGAKEGLKISLEIIPTMLAMVLAVNIFINSNLISDLFHGNSEIISMAFLRPISGNASLGMLSIIFKKYGVDSFYGFLGSIIQGATDTTVYVLALYFSSIGIKKTRYALLVGLFADMCGIIAAFIVAKFFF